MVSLSALLPLEFPILHDYISTICQSPEARLISQKRAHVTEKRIENDLP